MTPIKFEGSNIVFAEDQPQYQDLPAHRDSEDQSKPVVTCWEMTAEERKEFDKTGKIYLTLLTFGKPLEPIKMEVKNPL